MEIRQLSTPQEQFESERVIETAFLHPWDEDEARKRKESGAGEAGQQAWAVFDDEGRMTTSVSTLQRRLAFGGEVVTAGEIHMVGTLPEHRGTGGVRALMRTVLRDFAARGDALAVLIPFSCSFYRKFGFEIAARTLRQRVATEQLAGFDCPLRVTQLRDKEDLAAMRALADTFARERNLAEILPNDAWAWRGNGDFGAPDWLHPERQRYTYLFWDEDGVLCAYLRFSYFHEPGMPFVGELEVCDLVYTGPTALRATLGFLHRMRAKVHHVNFDLPDVDLTTMLPESDKVEQTVDSHVMARLLDIPRMLQLMPQPKGSGSYVIGTYESFLPESTGRYQVCYEDGRATSVTRCDLAADLQVQETTLTQLVVGRIGLDEARYRPGTLVAGNEQALAQAFVRRPVHLT